MPQLSSTAQRLLHPSGMDVIQQIELAMRTSGVTRAELARRIGHQGSSAVVRLLGRKHEPGDELLADIATALDIELVIPATPKRVIMPRVNVIAHS